MFFLQFTLENQIMVEHSMQVQQNQNLLASDNGCNEGNYEWEDVHA